MRTPILIASSTALSLCLAMGASAAIAADAAPAVKIAYQDLDLNSAAGARTMLDRIGHAAADVCRADPRNLGGSLGAMEQMADCYQTVVKTAVRTLDAPRVTAALGGTVGLVREARR